MATLTLRNAAAAVALQRPLAPDLLGFVSSPLTSSPPTLTASPAIRNGVILLLAAAALLALLLPGALPYVFWAMPETVLTALVLAALALAAGGEERPRRAAAAGLVLGLALLVRESALFTLPAMLALLRGRARRAALAALLAFALLVYAPLSRERGPGGATL